MPQPMNSLGREEGSDTYWPSEITTAHDPHACPACDDTVIQYRRLVEELHNERQRNAELVEVLTAIRMHVGRGASDVVVANTILGRIDQEARNALTNEVTNHQSTTSQGGSSE